MILCADIGNTTIKIAVVDAAVVIAREIFPTGNADKDASLDLAVHRVFSSVLGIEAAIVSSVVPEATKSVCDSVQRCTSKTPSIVSHNLRLPFEIAVPVAGGVGTDRICAMVGAISGRRRSAIVVDAGTAITVDMVRNGVFLGGVIAPGLAMSLEAMHNGARQLPPLGGDVLGDGMPGGFDTTEQSMILGALLGAAGCVRESVRFLCESVGARPTVTLTGGGAPLLRERLPSAWGYDPDLTLRGLASVALLNRENTV